MRRIVIVGVAAAWTLPALVGLGERAVADGPTEAPTGFSVESNGFAEEFCANQDALTNSPNSPQIPDEECDFEAAVEEFTGPETTADGLGPDLQRGRLRRVPYRQPDPRSNQPDHRAAGRLLERQHVHRPSGRIADPGPVDAIRTSRSASSPPPPTSSRSVRPSASSATASSRPSATRPCRTSPTRSRRPARTAHQRSRAREAGHHAHRTLRPQGPAGQPGVVLGGRLPERDGHHQPPAADRELVERPAGAEAVRRASRNRRRRRGRRAVRAVHALDAGPAGGPWAPELAGRTGGQRALQPDRLRGLPHAHDRDFPPGDARSTAEP